MKLRTPALFAALSLPLVALNAYAQGGEESAEGAITKYPAIIEAAEATYPPFGLRDRIEATVELEIEISETGTISDVLVVSTTTIAETLSATTAAAYGVVRSATVADYGFAQAATAAVNRMRFSPAEVDGVPVPVRVPFRYAFELPPLPPLPDRSSPEADGGARRQLSLQGIFRERGSRSLIPGVVVTVFRQEGQKVEGYEATSDARGVFRFYDLPPGNWKIQGEVDGFFPLRDSLDIVEGQVTEVTYFLEKGSYGEYDVIVEAERVKREINRRTLTREEIRTVPGTLGDPILVVENLPGVARAGFGTGAIIVRGSGPQDTGVFIDGVDVPLILHFGGLKSVIPVDIVDTVDFYPGNFSVFYGRGTGGIFDAHVKNLEPDQVHGSVELSTLDVSLFAETPVGKNFAIAGGIRRSIVGDVISAFVPEDAATEIISAPVYYDGQVLANWQPNAENKLRLFFLASDDVLELLFGNPSEASTQLTGNNVRTAVNFQRGTIEHRYAPGEDFSNTLLFAVGRDRIDLDFFGFFFRLENFQFQLRNTSRWKLSERIALRVGFDGLLLVTDVDAETPGRAPAEGETGSNPDISDEEETQFENFLNVLAAPFVELEWQVTDRLSVVPGLRLDYFQLVDQWSLDPRVVARYEFFEKLTAKAGVGVVFQAPQPQEVLEPNGNPALGLQRGIQYSVGAEFGLPNGLGVLSNLSFDVTFFYKDLDDLVAISDDLGEDADQLNFSNQGIGRVIGLETFIEHKFKDNFRGFLSYTLSRAERRDAPDEDFRLFDFDQTHILTLVLSYLLPENWEVGLRWRFVSGNPSTPSLSVLTNQSYFLDDFDVHQNAPGEVNSVRLPTFHQLDLRVEKRWVFDYFTVRAFLSIINTYNRSNQEGFSFNFDFTQQAPVNGLPLFPNIGLRAEF